jgi:DNA-binding XRE family transcriptional regulator
MRDIYTFYPKVRAIQRLEGPARLINTPFNIPNVTPVSKGLDCGLTRDFHLAKRLSSFGTQLAAGNRPDLRLDFRRRPIWPSPPANVRRPVAKLGSDSMALSGKQFKSARQLLGWSQSRLAGEAAARATTIGRLERGTQRVPASPRINVKYAFEKYTTPSR